MNTDIFVNIRTKEYLQILAVATEVILSCLKCHVTCWRSIYKCKHNKCLNFQGHANATCDYV